MAPDSTDLEVLDLLPDELRQIAEEIGVDAALKLVSARGGVCLYVPMVMTPDHPIARLIGMEAARKLSKRYQGERIEIPRAVGWRRALRDVLIYQQSGRSKTRMEGQGGAIRPRVERGAEMDRSVCPWVGSMGGL